MDNADMRGVSQRLLRLDSAGSSMSNAQLSAPSMIWMFFINPNVAG